ncbi:SRPBCC family protein [Nocardioides sp. Kera G14]|uniref:SRPBCC family protein n=1 Tax=Nocardioides sp. Kera G14 TaxID=2884264 RepID=UPI001D11833C|nr:SRPBCC family protein [Nocardioides sp. Kera G14]UDY23780.1 SRPBCC family protein [Nocardioides sp. Kera G14]
MSTIEKSITVDIPVTTAYNQWTQFETFPKFMDGVERVEQLDDKHLHWKAKIAGVSREWDAEIVDQTPDERISWRATDGTTNVGTVSFASSDPSTTQVTLRLEVEPEGFVEKVGDALHLIDHEVEKDLANFKEFVEAHGYETGAWRGDINPGDAGTSTTGFTDPLLGGGAGAASTEGGLAPAPTDPLLGGTDLGAGVKREDDDPRI